MLKKLLTLVATAAILTGCYHAATTTTPTTQSKTGAVMEETKIDIKNFAFSPNQTTVKPGAKITVTNNDITGHSFTADDGKSFDTGILAQGKSATVTAPTTPGSYPFHCTPHPNMQGTLVVKE